MVQKRKKMQKTIYDEIYVKKYIDDYIPPEPEDVKPGLKIKIEGK